MKNYSIKRISVYIIKYETYLIRINVWQIIDV